MNWQHLIITTLYGLAQAAPWLLAGLAAVGLVAFSPLGRALTGYLRAPRREAELLEAILAELGDIRQALVETNERLDATERRLGQLPPPALPGRIPTPPERIATPH